MDFSRLNEFLSIFSESIKLLPKNWKLIAFVTSFSSTLYVSLKLLFDYSMKSLLLDESMQQSLMSTPESGFDLSKITSLLHQLQRDTAFLLAVEVIFLLAFLAISFITAISTILVSSISYNSKNSSIRELISMICRSWRRPLVISMYISTLTIGYFATIAIFASPLWMYPNLPKLGLGMVILIPSFAFYLYLLVPWILALVISVAEERVNGLEALGRAAVLVKGKRLHGFLLNVIHSVLVSIIFQCYKIKIWGDASQTAMFVFVTCISSFVNVFKLISYTVLYFQCKRHHDEEIELHGGLKYTKLSTSVLANDMP